MAYNGKTGSAVRASKEPKDNKKLPKGAKVVSKETSVTVREIENGFLTCVKTEYRYTVGKDEKYPDYLTVTKEHYTEEDPLEIKIADKIPALADVFDDDSE